MANNKLNLLSGITRHDIRNQLMALKAFIQLSEDSIHDPGHMAELLKKEEMIADTIERQINFTSDYEDMGVKSPVWQNVEAIVRKAASELLVREIRIETDCPGLEIFADPLLGKVFFNLIDNALRYGGDTMNAIRFTAAETNGGAVIVCEDDGSGISAGDKERLFGRGFGHNTGLGLFLSREILSITGITITETGEPGKGARFEILVPEGGYRFLAGS
jgi:signal transduction histidine kinase